MNMPDQVFSVFFALIVLLAAAPQAREFLLKIEKTKIECKRKMEMLKRGHTADEIVQSISSRCERESTSQRI